MWQLQFGNRVMALDVALEQVECEPPTDARSSAACSGIWDVDWPASNSPDNRFISLLAWAPWQKTSLCHHRVKRNSSARKVWNPSWGARKRTARDLSKTQWQAHDQSSKRCLTSLSERFARGPWDALSCPHVGQLNASRERAEPQEQRIYQVLLRIGTFSWVCGNKSTYCNPPLFFVKVRCVIPVK